MLFYSKHVKISFIGDMFLQRMAITGSSMIVSQVFLRQIF